MLGGAKILRIGYGAVNPDSAPHVAIEPDAARPLRLWDGPYPFAEPPDLTRLITLSERLDFLKQHLQSLCGVWAKPPRAFLDAYFAWIAATLAANRAAIEPLAGAGLFAAEDWSFAAFRPLPSAHLPAGGSLIRADIAFWTGQGFVALELLGGDTVRAARRRELDALRRAGIAVVEMPPGDLTPLPESLTHFWRDVRLPKSPFGPRDLAIEPAR